MKRKIWAALGLVSTSALLGGCARLNDTGLMLFASSVPAAAIVNGVLFQGDLTLTPDHTGTLNLREDPATNPDVVHSCVGRLRYTGTTMAAVDVRCTGGVIADVRVSMLGETRGYGYGPTATGEASLVFGMEAPDAKAHLKTPAGKVLVERPESTLLDMR